MKSKIKKLKNWKKGLAFFTQMWYHTLALRSGYAPVAQLDRVTDYESVGRGFESLPAYQRKTIEKRSEMDSFRWFLFIYQTLQNFFRLWNTATL